MRAISLAIGVASFILACCRVHAADPETAGDPLRDAVTFIRVEVLKPQQDNASIMQPKELTRGSGFLIDELGHILTARHIIKWDEKKELGPRLYWVSLRGRDSSPDSAPSRRTARAQIVACEEDPIDICLLKISSSTVQDASITQFFSLACRPVTIDEGVWSYGYPPNDFDSIAHAPGTVIGEVGAELKIPFSVGLNPGMSGGPVVDKRNRVVGVNVGVLASGQTTKTALFTPLIYGIGLVQRAGVPCESTAAVRQHSVSSCGEIERVIKKVQDAERNPHPTRHEYSEPVVPEPGCHIMSIQPEVLAKENLLSDPKIEKAPDGSSAEISFALESGTLSDRYRGMVQLKLVITQAPNK